MALLLNRTDYETPITGLHLPRPNTTGVSAATALGSSWRLARNVISITYRNGVIRYAEPRAPPEGAGGTDVNESRMKGVVLYDEMRRSLRAGKYLPGQRIDPVALADLHNTSQTPVRDALHMLIGAHLIEDQGRAGVFVLLPSPKELRDTYEWMRHVLLEACGTAALSADPRHPLEPAQGTADATWRLFHELTRNNKHPVRQEVAMQANDHLAPVRHAKEGLIPEAWKELANIHQLWTRGDWPALSGALNDYHDRRIDMASTIVDHLHDRLRGIRDP